MKVPTITKTRPRRRLPVEDARQIKAAVHRKTGLRLDLARIANEEAHELHALVRADSEHRLDTTERRRWEKLVETAAAQPGWFAKQRAAAKLEREQEAQRIKPKAHPMLAPGSIVIPPLVLASLQQRNMSATHFLLVMVIIASLQNQAPLHTYMQVNRDAVIVDQAERLISPIDLYGDISRIGQALKELHDAGWLQVEKQGTVTIRLAGALADAMREAA